MTAPPRPRAPLPRRVYWVRRLVLLMVVAVVLGTGYGLVDALADAWRGRGGPTLVTTTGAGASPTPTAEPSPTTAPTTGPTTGPTDGRPRQRATEEPPEPEGVCPDADVVVEPRLAEAHVGEPIRIVLEISTRATPACTWEVSPDSVFLKVVRGGDSAEVVWSSQHCPAAMPTAQIVARRKQAAEVVVSWSGRISDAECSTLSGWVLPGDYRAVSVARGAVTPLEEEFRLRKAVPEVVVSTPTPTPTPTSTPTSTPSAEPTEDR